MCLSPQIRNSTLGLYRYFKASSRFLINRLKSPVDALCKLNMISLDDLVSSSAAQISKSFSLQLCEILIFPQHRSLRTKIHTPTFCRFRRQKLDPNI